MHAIDDACRVDKKRDRIEQGSGVAVAHTQALGGEIKKSYPAVLPRFFFLKDRIGGAGHLAAS